MSINDREMRPGYQYCSSFPPHNVNYNTCNHFSSIKPTMYLLGRPDCHE